MPANRPMDQLITTAGFDSAGPEFFGAAQGLAVFLNTPSFPISGPVFLLLEGFTAESADGRIVDNRWLGPETAATAAPGPPSLALLAGGGAAALACRRRRPGSARSLTWHPRQRRSSMPKYVIERDVPGVGAKTAAELRDISKTSCNVLGKLGPEITWVTSYVTGDKFYCVYIAPNEEIIREHARLGGFPANRISRVTATIDPATAEG